MTMEKTMKKVDNRIIEVEKFFIKLLHLTKFEDKIMTVFNPETVIYLIVGVLTTIVNYVVYAVLIIMFPGSEVISNIIAWVVAVVATFYPNKFFVFRKPHISVNDTLREFISFISSRLATLGIETLGLWIFCDLLHFNGLIIKAILAVVVVILNYVFSKIFVFKNK